MFLIAHFLAYLENRDKIEQWLFNINGKSLIVDIE